MKRLILLFLLVIPFLNVFSQEVKKEKINLSGKYLEQAGAYRVAGYVCMAGGITLSATGLITNSDKSDGTAFIWVGGGLSLAGVVLNFVGDVKLIQSGRELQKATVSLTNNGLTLALKF